MYSNLLISCGGGILPKHNKAEQGKDASIIIGLGDIGTEAVECAKREIYSRVRPDEDSANGETEYKHIKFLAVDSERRAFSNVDIDSIEASTEFFDISTTDVCGLIKSAERLRKKPQYKWLNIYSEDNPNGFELNSADEDTVHAAQISRLLLFRKYNSLYKKIEKILLDASKNLNGESAVVFHVFAGMGDSAGAGTYLDVCYMIRAVSENLGLNNCIILGYFFLPDITYLKKSNEAASKYIWANGYAALKQLDHCFNFENNSDCWNEVYDSFTYKTKKAPVDLAYLISSKDINGNSRDDMVSYSINSAVESLMEFVVKHESSWSAKAHIYNIRNAENTSDSSNDRRNNYCIIGAASAGVPYKDILTYLASGFFKKIEPLKDKSPIQDDLDDFLKRTAIDYRQLKKQLSKNVEPITDYGIDYGVLFKEAALTCDGCIPQALFFYKRAFEKGLCRLDSNYDAMIGSAKLEAPCDSEIESALSRIDAELTNILQNSSQGPFFTESIIKSDIAPNIKKYLKICTNRCEQELDYANLTLQKSKLDMDESLSKIKCAGAFNIHKKQMAKAYADNVVSYFNCKREFSILQSLFNLLKKLTALIDDIYNQKYRPFADFMREIYKTFENNRCEFENTSSNKITYIKPVVTIKDIKNRLDDKIESLDIKVTADAFLNKMFTENAKAVKENNEENISRAVCDYFIDIFSEYANMDMSDYLKIKFGTSDTDILAQRTYEEIIVPLLEKATPFFWTDEQVKSPSILVCSAPTKTQVIKSEIGKDCVSTPLLKISASCGMNRISIVNLRCGIPLCTYAGIKHLGKEPSAPGIYLHEGASGDYYKNDSENIGKLRDNRNWQSIISYNSD